MKKYIKSNSSYTHWMFEPLMNKLHEMYENSDLYELIMMDEQQIEDTYSDDDLYWAAIKYQSKKLLKSFETWFLKEFGYSSLEDVPEDEFKVYDEVVGHQFDL